MLGNQALGQKQEVWFSHLFLLPIYFLTSIQSFHSTAQKNYLFIFLKVQFQVPYGELHGNLTCNFRACKTKKIDEASKIKNLSGHRNERKCFYLVTRTVIRLIQHLFSLHILIIILSEICCKRTSGLCPFDRIVTCPAIYSKFIFTQLCRAFPLPKGVVPTRWYLHVHTMLRFQQFFHNSVFKNQKLNLSITTQLCSC